MRCCSARGWLWVERRRLPLLDRRLLLPTMNTLRISQLTAEQVRAVFSSPLFCQLTDRQLAALHRRDEQLKALQHQARQRRQRRVLVAVAVVAALAALAPIWHIVAAMGLMALVWLGVIAMLWDAGQKLRASITGSGTAAEPASSTRSRG